MARCANSMIAVVVLSAAFAAAWSSLTAERASDAAYEPVAPAQAVHVALKANLKIVADWLGDRDYASAALDAGVVTALAELYRYQGSDPGWREQSRALLVACEELTRACARKDAAGSRAALARSAELVEQLGEL